MGKETDCKDLAYMVGVWLGESKSVHTTRKSQLEI